MMDKFDWSGSKINMLQKGDSLVCDESHWRIDCLDDLVNSTKKVYYVSHYNIKKVKKVRVDALVAWLISKNVPNTLEYVQDGAIGHLKKHYEDYFLGIDHTTHISYIDEDDDDTGTSVLDTMLSNLTKIHYLVYNKHTFIIQKGQIGFTDD